MMLLNEPVGESNIGWIIAIICAAVALIAFLVIFLIVKKKKKLKAEEEKKKEEEVEVIEEPLSEIFTFRIGIDDPESFNKVDENIRLIRIENVNNMFFTRLYGEVKNPDAEIVVYGENKLIIIRNGVPSDPLSAGSHRIYSEEDVVVKDDKRRLKSSSLIDIVVYNPELTYQSNWGTLSPIPYRDPETSIPVNFIGNGKYDVRIADIKKFLNRIIGSSRSFDELAFQERINSSINQVIRSDIAKVIHNNHLSYLDMDVHTYEIAEAIQPKISESLNDMYGVFVPMFAIEMLKIPEAERNAIEARLAALRDKAEFDKEAKEIAAELERLDEKAWERKQYLLQLETANYDKYLEVIKILSEHAASNPLPKGNHFCPKCGVEVGAEDEFCPSCGVELKAKAINCPHCGKAIGKAKKYCPHCGKPLKK